MATYLHQTTEVYRADTEKEAADLIEKAKKGKDFSLVKYSSTYKEVTAKKEVVDSYYKVSLTKYFTDLKEPVRQVIPTYEEGIGNEDSPF